MQDYIGNQLKVGDTLAFTSTETPNMRRGTVTAISGDLVQLEFRAYTCAPPQIFLCKSDQVIKIMAKPDTHTWGLGLGV